MGFSAPTSCYSVMDEGESNSVNDEEETIAQTITRQENENTGPPMAWDDRMN